MSTLVPVSTPTAHRRLAIVVVLGTLAVIAWIASVHRMDGMSMGSRFSVGSLGFFVVLWVLMMAAMMFPSVWPSVAVHALVIRRRTAADARSLARSTAFVSGYLGSWTVFGLLAFGVLALARSGGLDSVSAADLARYGVAPTALAAAAYQVVPLKRVCLRNCRGPLSFFIEHWRDGMRGALLMGLRNGAYCVGCCWLLMGVLLAVGVMSITWMAVISVAIAVEKLAPAHLTTAASAMLTVGLVALAVVALAKPSWLPGVSSGMGGRSDGGTSMTRS